ncbi:PREDICTED: polyubiquitin-like [Poecilia mexicana]|uniref:polyubiquitin-like n=1 Tax=Poecilia mexicana TaxID=48701 RepID=UPI00072E4049|nr:PREDICTED: polyubiquitin-like [Poecilia mexicana]
MVCEVIVCFEQNRKIPFGVCQQEKDLAITPVQRLKDQIQERRPEIEKTKMGLIYKAQTMEETRPLADYGIKHKSEVHAVIRCDGGLELIVLDSAPL